jgi:hypothetical protein
MLTNVVYTLAVSRTEIYSGARVHTPVEMFYVHSPQTPKICISLRPVSVQRLVLEVEEGCLYRFQGTEAVLASNQKSFPWFMTQSLLN